MSVYEFSTENSKILDMFINSLYTKREIFVRELISNAFDACEKARQIALSDDTNIDKENLKIVIEANKDAKKLIITDNGIGMNEDDLKKYLGTIAKSGTLDFVANKDKNKELIGQFGVGFYSVFMVSKDVTVETTKYDSDKTFRWHSDGKGSFSIDAMDEKLPTGTKITIVLSDDALEYLEFFKIRHVVESYSSYIAFPIEFIKEEDSAVEKLNAGTAIWQKRDISEDEHRNFFRDVAHVGGDPWIVFHNINEGIISYTNLLYIPKIKPFDLFHPDRKVSVKLYVRRVFISDDNDTVPLLPRYLRFVKGVIDSDDLPLNINRETLQHNTVLAKIRNSVEKRILNELKKKLDDDDYKSFWDNFGDVLKEGLCDQMNTDMREKLLDICCFNTTMRTGVTLASYMDSAANKDKKKKKKKKKKLI